MRLLFSLLALAFQMNAYAQGCDVRINANSFDVAETRLEQLLVKKGYTVTAHGGTGQADFEILLDVDCNPEGMKKYCEGWVSFRTINQGTSFSGSAESSTPKGALRLLARGLKKLPECQP